MPGTTLTGSRQAAKLCTMSRRLWSHIEARDLRLQATTHCITTMALWGINWKLCSPFFGSSPVLAFLVRWRQNGKSRGSWRKFPYPEIKSWSGTNSPLPPTGQGASKKTVLRLAFLKNGKSPWSPQHSETLQSNKSRISMGTNIPSPELLQA